MSFVSILNNDNNPSFAVRPSRPTRHHSSSSSQASQSHSLSHTHSSSYSSHSHALSIDSHASQSHAVRPRSHSHALSQSAQSQRLSDYYPYDPVRPLSPGSSVGSLDYPPSSCGSFVQSNPESHVSAATASTSTSSTTTTTNASNTTTTHRASKTPPGDQPPSPQSVQSSSRRAGSGSGTAAGIRKNKYPCPYASSHNCPATFTTSGHAARHGKKHTGEKSVLCPICNKAFTRKDNMKQHIRTHRNSTSP